MHLVKNVFESPKSQQEKKLVNQKYFSLNYRWENKIQITSSLMQVIVVIDVIKNKLLYLINSDKVLLLEKKSKIIDRRLNNSQIACV